ncbi:stage V sporulation protein AB [Bacillus suaedaesalsae]|uniref:Stage V sporulation protein AB n=1 Tax=Bacillus suaedaesalsae TaxID=2810349 RepID=A0ABS2DNH4_9BACI|nr:stage V sporulation protein AB [Bacillus suaedaesalsae]MBM6619947.1 stage V sporulation protein AB [Bacillus suaedaesalsae]
MVIKYLLVIFIGLAGGLAVGAGIVAFLSVLGIIPRLTQLTKTVAYVQGYEWGIVGGAIIGGILSLRDYSFFMSSYWLIPLGAMYGIFVGMLAAALTEVLNVFPILSKRMGIYDRIIILLMAIVMGKIVGSLYHWIYFVDL